MRPAFIIKQLLRRTFPPSPLMSVVSLVALVLAYPLSADDSESSRLETIRLQLKWKHQFQFAGYYAALEQGYYQDAGLAVEILEPEVGQEPARNVLDGDAEFGISTSDLVLMRAHGEPVVVLAPIYQHSPLIFAASKAAGIESIHDLAGKRVAVEPHAAELFAYLQWEGIPEGKLTLAPHSFDPQSLIDREVDAMSAYSTDEPFLLDQAGFEYLVLNPRAGGIDFYGDTLFTTEQQIREHPERVRKFLDASLRGWQYAMANPDEIIDLILDKYSRRHSREHLRFEAEKSQRLIIQDVVEIGYNNPGRWRHIADAYADLGMLPRDISLEGFIYDRNPKQSLAHLYAGFVIAILIMTILAMTVIHFLRLNRALTREIETSRRLATELERRSVEQRLILENANVGISFVKQRKIIWCNPAVATLFGTSVEKIIGSSTEQYYVNQSDYHRVGSHYLDTLAGGQNFRIEVPMKRTDGSIRTVDLIGGAIDAENPHEGAIWILSDTTDKRKTEQALHQAKEAAENAARIKTEFLANVSHEIRTPLNGIIGMTDILKSSLSSAQHQDMCSIILSSAESLLMLLNDVLDSARLEAGKIEIDQVPFDLHTLVNQVVPLFEPRANQKGIELKIEYPREAPRYFNADSLRIRQVITNLLSNSLKFTDTGTIQIRISASQPVDKHSQVIIAVSDTGIGIPRDRLHRIFQKFDQGDVSVVREYGGSGLGLNICTQLAELMGGKMEVESVEGKGSTFRLVVKLPVIEEEDKTDEPGSIRILLAESTEHSYMQHLRVLEEAGYSVSVADNGRRALERLKTEHIDLAFLDLNLEDLDACEIARRLSEDETVKDLPIIAMATDLKPGDRQRCQKSGIEDCIIKPLRREVLNEIISKWN